MKIDIPRHARKPIGYYMTEFIFNKCREWNYLKAGNLLSLKDDSSPTYKDCAIILLTNDVFVNANDWAFEDTGLYTAPLRVRKVFAYLEKPSYKQGVKFSQLTAEEILESSAGIKIRSPHGSYLSEGLLFSIVPQTLTEILLAVEEPKKKIITSTCYLASQHLSTGLILDNGTAASNADSINFMFNICCGIKISLIDDALSIDFAIENRRFLNNFLDFRQPSRAHMTLFSDEFIDLNAQIESSATHNALSDYADPDDWEPTW